MMSIAGKPLTSRGQLQQFFLTSSPDRAAAKTTLFPDMEEGTKPCVRARLPVELDGAILHAVFGRPNEPFLGRNTKHFYQIQLVSRSSWLAAEAWLQCSQRGREILMYVADFLLRKRTGSVWTMERVWSSLGVLHAVNLKKDNYSDVVKRLPYTECATIGPDKLSGFLNAAKDLTEMPKQIALNLDNEKTVRLPRLLNKCFEKLTVPRLDIVVALNQPLGRKLGPVVTEQITMLRERLESKWRSGQIRLKPPLWLLGGAIDYQVVGALFDFQTWEISWSRFGLSEDIRLRHKQHAKTVSIAASGDLACVPLPTRIASGGADRWPKHWLHCSGHLECVALAPKTWRDFPKLIALLTEKSVDELSISSPAMRPEMKHWGKLLSVIEGVQKLTLEMCLSESMFKSLVSCLARFEKLEALTLRQCSLASLSPAEINEAWSASEWELANLALRENDAGLDWFKGVVPPLASSGRISSLELAFSLPIPEMLQPVVDAICHRNQAGNLRLTFADIRPVDNKALLAAGKSLLRRFTVDVEYGSGEPGITRALQAYEDWRRARE